MTPMRTRKSEVQDFLRSREGWIRVQLADHRKLEKARRDQSGKKLWLMGTPLLVETASGPANRIERSGGSIQVTSRSPLDEEVLARRLNRWLRAQSELKLPARVQQLSQQTGLQGSGLQIKSYTARWGSCRHDGLIQLNWKLIKTPQEVIDYVIIHELSHLKHFDHSKAFWSLVAQHCPAHQKHRHWLKVQGRLLLSN